MAYVLGFIAADGCVYNNDKGQRVLIIKLAYKDIDHLKLIRDLISPTSNIRIFYEKINDNKYKQCSLSIGSKYMYKRLNELGIIPQKSKYFVIPQIPHLFKKDFIRGFFDGDGSIYFLKNENKWRTSFVGTKEFLTDLSILLKDEVDVKRANIQTRKDSFICQIKYGKYDSIKLCNWMYSDANIKLSRKYDKYKTLLSNIGDDND